MSGFGFDPMGGFLGAFIALLIIYIVWELFWKGLAFWHAARNGQWIWFIAFLLVHTLGILEIIYLFGFRKDRETTSLFDLGLKHTHTHEHHHLHHEQKESSADSSSAEVAKEG